MWFLVRRALKIDPSKPKPGYLMNFKFAGRSKSKLYLRFALALDIGFEFAADFWVF